MAVACLLFQGACPAPHATTLCIGQHASLVGPLPTSPTCPSARRGHLGDVEVAAPLLALAADPDAEVALQAVGTLANMAVDFSAVKEQLLAHDGVARFAALADSMQPQLRLHGVWGLSSVAYMATPEVRPGAGVMAAAAARMARQPGLRPVSHAPLLCAPAAQVKQSIAQQLPWSSVVVLLEDPEPEVRVGGAWVGAVANAHGRPCPPASTALSPYSRTWQAAFIAQTASRLTTRTLLAEWLTGEGHAPAPKHAVQCRGVSALPGMCCLSAWHAVFVSHTMPALLARALPPAPFPVSKPPCPARCTPCSCSQHNIQAVLNWSCNTLLEAVRDVLERSRGQAGVRQDGAWGACRQTHLLFGRPPSQLCRPSLLPCITPVSCPLLALLCCSSSSMPCMWWSTWPAAPQRTRRQ